MALSATCGGQKYWEKVVVLSNYDDLRQCHLKRESMPRYPFFSLSVGQCGKTISIAKQPPVSYLQQRGVVYPADKRYPRLVCTCWYALTCKLCTIQNLSPRKQSSIVDPESDIVDPQNWPQSKGSRQLLKI